MNLLKLSWKNLTNKPLAMALSLVLFALGIGLISLLLILDKQLQENFEKNLAGIDLVVGAKGSPLQLILMDLKEKISMNSSVMVIGLLTSISHLPLPSTLKPKSWNEKSETRLILRRVGQ